MIVKTREIPSEKVRHLETPLLGFPGRLLHLDYKYTQHPVRTVGHTCTLKWTSVWKLFDIKSVTLSNNRVDKMKMKIEEPAMQEMMRGVKDVDDEEEEPQEVKQIAKKK